MSVASVAGTARAMLRDFPTYFEIEAGPLNILTVRLPHPLVSSETMQVYVGTPGALPDDPWTSALTSAWSLDERNGLLKITDPSLLGARLLVSAYHYTWFTDADLLMHANQQSSEILYSSGGGASTLDGVLGEVTAMGTVVRALWSLATELALDIDVSTPEGMFIPARQRFAQIIQMMQYWEGQYSERAAALGVGLGAFEIFRLRRVAYLTGRYVPVYKEREVDDHSYPKRLYPPIPDGTLGPAEGEIPDIIEVTEGLQPVVPPVGQVPVWDLGWQTIGTRGDWP